MRKKNILIVAGVFPPEPIVSANLMYDLALELSKEYNVTVLRPYPTRPTGFKFDEYDNAKFPFKVIEIPSYTHPQSNLIGRFRESISCGKEAAKYVKAHHDEIDFIYNDPWQLFGVNIVAKEAVKHGIPYIMAVQDIYPEAILAKLPNIIGKAIEKILMPIDVYNESHAARVHTISDKMVDHLSQTRGLPKSHFISVRNWQNEKSFTDYEPLPKVESSPFTFMYMGNVGPLAGLETVIDAFHQAKLEGARLVIAGSGSAKDSLRMQVENLKLDNVEFWDVPNGKVPEIQSLADVMVLPVKKGFAMSSIPSKLPAYMFSKKPVLASVDEESDTAKCIIDADAGWVIEPENPIALAKSFAMIRMMNDEKLKLAGERGFEFAMKKLSRSGNLPILVNAIKETLS